MVLSAFCMAFGVVYFGYVVAYVSASLSSENTLRSEYQDDLDGLKIFLQVGSVKKRSNWYAYSSYYMQML